jgi:hypothetical protein
MNKYLITHSIKGIKHIYFQKKNFCDKQKKNCCEEQQHIKNLVSVLFFGMGCLIGTALSKNIFISKKNFL